VTTVTGTIVSATVGATGVTEVLKDLSVFVSYCNFHCAVSFAFSIVKDFKAFLN